MFRNHHLVAVYLNTGIAKGFRNIFYIHPSNVKVVLWHQIKIRSFLQNGGLKNQEIKTSEIWVGVE